MMHWKVFERKRLWPNFKVLSQNSPGETEKNRKKLSLASLWTEEEYKNFGTTDHK
jgi:hypothetical protein